VALAAVAVAALLVNAWQARLTSRAVSVTVEDVRESRRARVDVRAPRVVVYDKLDPRFPAALAQSTVTGSRFEIQPGTRFDLPGQADQGVALTAYVRLCNEGAASAFLALPIGVVAVPGPGDRPNDEDLATFRWATKQKLTHWLAPGASQWFLLEDGHTIAEWAARWRTNSGELRDGGTAADLPGVRFEFAIRDQFVGSFVDTLTVDVLALPLQPVQGSDSAWQARSFVGDPFKMVADTRVIGTTRDYGGS
jgi:hypothetical protein